MAEHIEYQGNFSGSQIDTLLAKIQSSQVFTTEEKTKLASLVNYDDTEVKEDISDIETSLNSHKTDTTNPHRVTKTQVGLGNVDNTSDANKPISTATQAVLNNKVDKATGKGLSTNDFTNGYKSQITTNKNAIDNINSELSVPVISSSTSLTDYANALSRGYHTAFFTSASKPSDAPISDNCFVEIFVYSGSTAIMRVMPTGTAHYANNYVKTKVSGAWQTGWVVFAGTAQSGS